MERLFLIDAYALIFRSYYAFINRPMRSPSGMNTSAIYGFVKFLDELIRKESPHFLGVAFDPKGGNFRHELYPDYKANRSATPEDIIAAVPYIKQILDAYAIPVLEVAGYEADDVIGTLSKKGEQQGLQVYMVTPDKDFAQLLSPSISMYKQRKGGEGIETIGMEQFAEHYGFAEPAHVADMLAIWGDASDNIPGVMGIGEKGAIKLVRQFGTVENLLEHLGELKGKQRENIEQGREQLLLSKRLATISTDVPVELDLGALALSTPDSDLLTAIYADLGFRTLLQSSGARGKFLPKAEGATASARVTATAPVATSSTPQSPAPNLSAEPLATTAATPPTPALDLFSASAPAVPAATTTSTPTTSTIPATPTAPSAQPDLFSGMLDGATPAPTSASAEADAPLIVGLSVEPIEPVYATVQSTPHRYECVQGAEQLVALVERLAGVSRLCLDTETMGVNPISDALVGISLSVEAHSGWYLPCTAHTTAQVVEALRPIFEDERIEKVGQNLKFDRLVLEQVGIRLRGRYLDTMIIHYLLDPESRHGMDHLARTYLNYNPIPIEQLIGRGARQLTMDRVALDTITTYACEDADITLQLYEVLWDKLQEAEQVELYNTIEEPLIGVLADMERTGVKVDVEVLSASREELIAELASLEAQIRELTGEPALNVNSAKQLGEALFAKLKIDPKPKRTKTKQYRTDEEYLQSLSHRHEVIAPILEYRGLRKLLSTYIDALPQLVNPHTGRIHTSFNQAVTATGRLSSTNPNLQNIPIREEQGRKIRRAFVASDSSHVLLSADYSQVELRLMAHLSEDPAMIEAFDHGLDIHAATAARIYGVPLEEVTREQRRRAKTANFGIIYGISAFGLAQRLQISRAEAKEIIDGYFASYPQVSNYMAMAVEQARERGYVETLFGRKRYLSDINSANAVVRSMAERNAINAPIQGGAADIMKLAMIRLHKALQEHNLQSRLTLQVHDEVVVDALRTEVEQVKALIEDAMEHAAKLQVQLLVECGEGENWLDAH